MPGVYLLEMMAMGVIGAFSVVNGNAERLSAWGAVTWAVVGVLAAFVVLGAWSIGLLFLPAVLIFAIVAILSDRRRSQNIILHLGLCVMAGLAQAGVMLAAIRLLYPNAAF
jgi:asparagine N-glycosylation enzyme membrane subunit Stt3